MGKSSLKDSIKIIKTFTYRLLKMQVELLICNRCLLVMSYFPFKVKKKGVMVDTYIFK